MSKTFEITEVEERIAPSLLGGLLGGDSAAVGVQTHVDLAAQAHVNALGLISADVGVAAHAGAGVGVMI